MQLKTFDNGIRLIHEFIEDSQIFSIRFCVMAGSNDEREDEWGIAHLLEHMTFKSTKNQTTKQISETMDRLGGHFNAYTSNETTVYYLTTTKYNAKEAVQCFCDILVNSQFDAEELENEKNVVCSELKMYEDDFPNVCMENLISNVFAGTPMEHPLGGTPESVIALNSEKLKEFKLRNYTPGRIIVSSAGGITMQEMSDLLKENLIKYYNKSEECLSYKRAELQPTPKTRIVFKKKDTDQVYFYISLPGGNKSSDLTEVETLINVILGGCMSSRLFVGVREEKGLVYHISAGSEKFSSMGVNVIRFFSNKENALKALEATKEVLDDLKANGIKESELMKAKEIFKTSQILNREKVSNITGQNLSNYIYRNEVFDILKFLDKINQISLEQLNNRLKVLLDYDKFTFSIVSNENNINPLTIFK